MKNNLFKLVVVSAFSLCFLSGNIFAAKIEGNVKYITNKFKTLLVVDNKTKKTEIVKFGKKTPTIKAYDKIQVTFKAGKNGKGIIKADSITVMYGNGSVSPAQFDKLKKSGAVVIDVRNAKDIKKGMIKNALHIPLNKLEKKMSTISKSKKTVLYCNSGVIAAIAYDLLKNNGYNNVQYLAAKVKFRKGVLTIK